ncbi:hypothetical protein [Peribacillus simplex]|uniref:hypothetical protein n=1 Tax=Peribacillus simplex TaxID=1478 RepID=UPI003D2C1BF6
MFKSDQAPVLEVLENLKNDPSLYVRKSVANNLNDIAKDHPKTVIELQSAGMKAEAPTRFGLSDGDAEP